MPEINSSDYRNRLKSQLSVAEDDGKLLSLAFKILCQVSSDITEQWVFHTKLKPKLGNDDWVVCRNRAGYIGLEKEALKRGCYMFYSLMSDKGRESAF